MAPLVGKIIDYRGRGKKSEGGVAGTAKTQAISVQSVPKTYPEYMACHAFPRNPADHRTPAHNTNDVVVMDWFTRVARPNTAM